MSYRNHCAQRRHATAVRTGRRMERFFAAVAAQLQTLHVERRPSAQPEPHALRITFSRAGDRLKLETPRALKARAA